MRDERVFLDDILECIHKIAEYMEGLTEQEFEQNYEKQDAVVRRIEIMGEAVKNISANTKSKYPNIRWRDIAGMRDIVIHQYFGVSIGMIWRVAIYDIPELKDEIEKILQDMNTN